MILASTILLVRDHKDTLEVFMAVRNPKVSFVPGTLVFPGGKVDPTDAEASLREYADGAEHLDPFHFSLRVAAIREAFEEAGVLLMRREGQTSLLSEEEATSLQQYRIAIESKNLTLLAFLQQERLRLACDLLLPFAHWITPERLPRRYDTHFFLARAPHSQIAEHDGSELVDSAWLTPEDAMEAGAAGTYTMIFPTRSNIRRLLHSTTFDDVWSKTEQQKLVAITPCLDTNDDGEMILCIPHNAGYDVCEELVEGNV